MRIRIWKYFCKNTCQVESNICQIEVGRMSEYMSNRKPHRISEYMSDRNAGVPNKMPDKNVRTYATWNAK